MDAHSGDTVRVGIWPGSRRRDGRIQYLGFYSLSGLLASLAQIASMAQYTVPKLGASPYRATNCKEGKAASRTLLRRNQYDLCYDKY
jgi:hypothetical protein